MNTNLALLLLLAPFIGFLFNVFFGTSENQLLGSLEPCCFFWLQLFLWSNNTIRVHFRLDSNQQFQGRFWFLLDQLSILWLLFVTGIGSLIHMYSISYMHDDENMHAYLNLFIFFMITLVIR
jgi:NADH-quinone oxidoreductase subunit L